MSNHVYASSPRNVQIFKKFYLPVLFINSPVNPTDPLVEVYVGLWTRGVSFRDIVGRIVSDATKGVKPDNWLEIHSVLVGSSGRVVEVG